jgi:hypothetical protein
VSAIATLVFHLEGEPLHVHFSALARGIEQDDPRQWSQVLRDLEAGLTDYAAKVAVVRARFDAQLRAQP